MDIALAILDLECGTSTVMSASSIQHTVVVHRSFSRLKAILASVVFSEILDY